MSGGHGAVDSSNKKVALLISVLALFLALGETLAKRGHDVGRIICRSRAQEADHRHARLLRARCERPRRRRAAQRLDEIASSHGPIP